MRCSYSQPEALIGCQSRSRVGLLEVIDTAETLDCSSAEMLLNISDHGSIIVIRPTLVPTQILPVIDEPAVVTECTTSLQRRQPPHSKRRRQLLVKGRAHHPAIGRRKASKFWRSESFPTRSRNHTELGPGRRSNHKRIAGVEGFDQIRRLL